ncbi:hypothetical protein DH2020_030829 [Rehmannia glutinosa]|uniref:Peptidase S54 rhomboid domain-containing protein n=1 Tax=Rehmannia glutinosa TaxID=99300 RepID=A0ABR0VJL7_REHGL
MSTAAVALRLSDALHRRFHLGFLLRSSLKSISHLGDVPLWKDMCHERALQFTGFNCFQWSFNALSSTLMSLSFFNGEESGSNKDFGKPQSRTSRRDLFKEGNGLIFFLLLMSCEVYIAQYVSDGKLLFWGAKINGLISKGQLWRLVTSSFLHANIGHLLVGSFAMFVLRHRGMVKGTEGDLKHIAQVIVLNMAIGLLSQGIDNWGHVGGLIGGAAASWLLGPAWKFESVSRRKKSFH